MTFRQRHECCHAGRLKERCQGECSAQYLDGLADQVNYQLFAVLASQMGRYK